MAWVTFQGRTTDGDLLRSVVVTVRDSAGAVFLQDSFGPRPNGMFTRVVQLPEGSYFFTARADGYRFPFLSALVITQADVDDHPPSDPRVVEVVGEPSLQPGSQLPCLVFGWVGMPSPNAAPGRHVEDSNAPVVGGPSVDVQISARGVTFRQVGPARPGEIATTLEINRTRVGFDRNGYFEAELVPGALYRVEMPGVAGSRYFVAPGPAVSQNVEDLIDVVRTLPINELLESQA